MYQKIDGIKNLPYAKTSHSNLLSKHAFPRAFVFRKLVIIKDLKDIVTLVQLRVNCLYNLIGVKPLLRSVLMQTYTRQQKC
jgi:hypothetical protein